MPCGDQLAVVQHHEAVQIDSTTFIRCSMTMMVTPCSAILRMMAERVVHLGLVEPGVDLVEHQQRGRMARLLASSSRLRRASVSDAAGRLGHVGQAR